MKVSGQIVDLFERSVYPGIITVIDGKIADVERCESAPDNYIVPGLVDAHVHVESSMVTPSHFAVAAVRHGTVAVVSDPHEIANVAGEDGVKFMVGDGQATPVKFMFGAPSCVPATSFESSGASIDEKSVERLLGMPGIGYLAEMMNFPGVIFNNPVVHSKLQAAHRAGVPIDGHAPGLTGSDLVKYVSAGISTDQECSTLSEAEEKIALGMKILIREGSAARNLAALAPLISSHPEMVMLCSDDIHPEMLVKGHINRLVSRLIEDKYDMFDVLRAATVNPANHYGLRVGLLRKGDPADFILVDNPASMNVLQTWIDGKCVFDGVKTLFAPSETKRINRFKCSRIFPSELRVEKRGNVIRVIRAFNGELITAGERADAGPGPLVEARPDTDLLKLVVKERYNDSPPAVAFIKGFGLRSGAIATSVAHDSHNIISVGTNDKDIAEAINLVSDASGGMSVATGGDREVLRLPVGGIMTDMPLFAVAGQYARLSERAKALGCTLDAPFMTLSFMALLVIPELKLSDKGLFDGKKFGFVSLFADNQEG